MNREELLECKRKFGMVGDMILMQEPYLKWGDAYWATAIKMVIEDGEEVYREYGIRWPIINANCTDESEACNWDDYKIFYLGEH